jgi:hypothetical protein
MLISQLGATRTANKLIKTAEPTRSAPAATCALPKWARARATPPRWPSLNSYKYMITIDAQDKTLGRVASAAAKALLGKHSATFAKTRGLGEEVRSSTPPRCASRATKARQKEYVRYSGYPGGQKIETYACSPRAGQKRLSAARSWACSPKTSSRCAHQTAHYRKLNMAMATKKKRGRYIEAVGRRKTAIARARLTPGCAHERYRQRQRRQRYFRPSAAHTR